MTVEINLSGKVALVSGGNGDIGSAIIDKLLEAGAKCYVVDVKSGKKKNPHWYSNGQAVEILIDYMHHESVAFLQETLSKNNDRIDILVNNAGFTSGGDFLTYTDSQWLQTIEINLTKPFLITQMIVKNFMTKGGSVINITSLAAEQGFPGNVAYVASKGGLKQLTKAMALDLGLAGIRVNAVGPGYVKTKMTAKSWSDEKLRNSRSARMITNRWAEPVDIANAVLFLSSELSEYINGQSIYVDGGWLAKGL